MNTQHVTPACERKAELMDYLYDEMPAAQRALFAGHLQTCAGCRADLQGLEQVRSELRAWDLSVVPRLELVIPRSKLEVLKELLALFPLWTRAGFATAAALSLVLMALGALSLFRQSAAVPLEVAKAPAPATQTASLTPELKTLINAEVAKALEQERQTLRAQLAALEKRGNEQSAELQAVTRRLRALNARHQEMLAAQRPSIRSIFAEFEPVAER